METPKKAKLKIILRLSVSLLLFLWLFYSVDWKSVWGALFGINVYWLALAGLWVIAAVAISTVKWQLLLRAQGLPVKWMELWRAYWVGLFFNNFLPSSIGGDGMRILRVGAVTKDPAGVAASVVMERLLAMLALALVGLVSSSDAVPVLPQLRWLFAVLLATSFSLIVIIVRGKVPAFLERKKGKLAGFIKNFSLHGQRLGKQPLDLLKVMMWSVAFQLAYVAVNYSLFQGLKISQVGFGVAAFVIPATAALAMVPVGVNGFGVREGAYVVLLAPYGVEKAAAFTASVLLAFLVCFCSAWGGILWLKTEHKGRKHDVVDASIHSGQRGL